MSRKEREEEPLSRLVGQLARNRARAIREELATPWHRGRHTPEAEAGRWLGLGIALGAALFGVGLALFLSLREDRA